MLVNVGWMEVVNIRSTKEKTKLLRVTTKQKKLFVMAGLSRLRGRSRFGEAKARPSTTLFCAKHKTWMPGTRLHQAEHDDVVGSNDYAWLATAVPIAACAAASRAIGTR
jgi:hypothetical protein